MEKNFSYNSSSYPDSVNSSPRSRDIDLENSVWDERIINTNYKVKLLCSYGGKIHLRPLDNQLTYVGGDTKILAVDRNIKFLGFLSKLSVLCEYSSDASFKYQLPGEDLDALISVTNDEDLEHMMLEYDRLYRSSAKPARLRLFIFPPLNFNSNSNSESGIYGSGDSKGRVGKWYEDVLNSVQINKSFEASSPRSEVSVSESERRLKNHPESFIGLDKGQPQPPPNLLDSLPLAPPKIMVKTEYKAVVPEERYVVGETPVTEIQRQIHEFQKIQISSSNENYYKQKDPLQPPPPRAMATPAANYWQGRNDFFPVGANNPPPQQPMYLIQTQTGVYQTPSMRPVTGHVNQPYYGVQGMVPSVYREPAAYDPMIQKVPSPNIQPAQVSGAAMVGLARPAAYDLDPMIQPAPSPPPSIQPAMVGLARPAAPIIQPAPSPPPSIQPAIVGLGLARPAAAYDPMIQPAPAPDILPAVVGLPRPVAYDPMIQQAPSSNIQPPMVGLARPAAGNAADGGFTLAAQVGLARPAAGNAADGGFTLAAQVGLARPAAGKAADGGFTLAAHEGPRREDYHHFP